MLRNCCACRHSCAPPHADRSPLSTRSASDFSFKSIQNTTVLHVQVLYNTGTSSTCTTPGIKESVPTQAVLDGDRHSIEHHKIVEQKEYSNIIALCPSRKLMNPFAIPNDLLVQAGSTLNLLTHSSSCGVWRVECGAWRVAFRVASRR